MTGSDNCPGCLPDSQEKLGWARHVGKLWVPTYGHPISKPCLQHGRHGELQASVQWDVNGPAAVPYAAVYDHARLAFVHGLQLDDAHALGLKYRCTLSDVCPTSGRGNGFWS